MLILPVQMVVLVEEAATMEEEEVLEQVQLIKDLMVEIQMVTQGTMVEEEVVVADQRQQENHLHLQDIYMVQEEMEEVLILLEHLLYMLKGGMVVLGLVEEMLLTQPQIQVMGEMEQDLQMLEMVEQVQ